MLYIWLYDRIQGVNVMVECKPKDMMPTLRAYPAWRYDFISLRRINSCVPLLRLA